MLTFFRSPAKKSPAAPAGQIPLTENTQWSCTMTFYTLLKDKRASILNCMFSVHASGASETCTQKREYTSSTSPYIYAEDTVYVTIIKKIYFEKFVCI